jgi:hypothetical protein
MPKHGFILSGFGRRENSIVNIFLSH